MTPWIQAPWKPVASQRSWEPWPRFLHPQASLFFSISSQSYSLESPGLSGWAAGEPEGGAATGRGLILLSGSAGPACPGWEADAGMLHPQLITCM